MKILITMTPAFNPSSGGVQRISFNLGKFFHENGLEVRYYSFAREGHIESIYGLLLFAPEEGGCRNERNIAHMESLLMEWRPDVVMNQMPYEVSIRKSLFKAKQHGRFLLLGCLMNSLFNFKNNAREVTRRNLSRTIFRFVDNFVGMTFIQLRHWWKHRSDLKKIVDEHDLFVLVAPPSKEELRYFIGDYKPEKIVVVPNSIPSIPAEEAMKEKIVLHVGRLNLHQKRSDLLLDVWKLVANHLPDWKFIVVGDGPYRETMNQRIKQESIVRVLLEGFQNPDAYYQKAPIFMMPSAFEGFPNVLLEAQSHGAVPVVFDSYKVLSWIVNDGTDAVLIKPFNTKAMAAALIDLAGKSDVCSVMARAARANVERFHIQKVGHQWLTLFKQYRQE